MEVFLFVLATIFVGGVSILLAQWITLEAGQGCGLEVVKQGFNPSGSMDYFGSFSVMPSTASKNQFQSFWVNGLLWKTNWTIEAHRSSWVSILLGQWITLEVR